MIKNCYAHIEQIIIRMIQPLWNSFQHRPELVLSCCGTYTPNSLTSTIEDILRDPFMLMGAPVSRRTTRVVRQRRRAPEKLIPHRTDLEPCPVCGNSKIRFYLCSICLRRVMDETYAIQEQMKEQYSNPFKPITKEIELQYSEEHPVKTSGDSKTNSHDLDQKSSLEDEEKIVLSMGKKRPSWFF